MSAERLVTLGTADSLLNLHIQMNCFIGNLKAIFYVYCHDKGASLSLAVNWQQHKITLIDDVEQQQNARN